VHVLLFVRCSLMVVEIFAQLIRSIKTLRSSHG